ncbi:putative transcriptional regulator [Burkholderia lata]|uniref:helix-turn-helix domain-containing protein n=1 Tax=Burkholderia lata (strain ATCC 17760 / DSM 23089 / LMG 22485 / NCIMB 9086 / R18194 / 383) TaxID=482957 RepID=UPI0014544B79|nr:helix-turn-helix transcriptional regulator [Burkholderia lata]VWD64096.1 putative transcriptional regulator [Burkholderia lata]
MSTKDTQSDIFSVRLKLERKRLGMNQTEFAAAGGVLQHAQVNYEKGARCPDASYLAGIAEVGVDIQYVLTGRPSDSATLALTNDEERLLAGFRELKTREKRGVLALVGAITGTPSDDQENGIGET